MWVEASVLLSLFVGQYLVPLPLGRGELLPRFSGALGEGFHRVVCRVVVVLGFLRTLCMLARILTPKDDEGVTGTRNPARILISITLCTTTGRGCDGGVGGSCR